ncbi:MAG TPA: hypothetical protein O0X39_05910 [Methanocorpusculum sp.]|nr:hypothetical protein [Methanocorpusculum sp.]
MKHILLWKAAITAVFAVLLIFAGAGAAEDKLFAQTPSSDIAGDLSGVTLTVPGTYKLSGDVTLTKTNLIIAGGTENSPVVLDLNGHALFGTGKSSVITVMKGAYFTLTDSNPGQVSYVRKDGSGVWKKSSKKQAKYHSEAILRVNSGGCIAGGCGTTVSGKTYGGAIYNEGTFIMNTGTLLGCDTDFGGAVYNRGGKITITNGNIVLNSAVNGGALYQDSGETKLEGGRFYENTAEKSGGAIYIAEGKLTMFQGAAVKDNIAGWRGGGLYAAEKTEIELKGGDIKENNAQTGGGVYAEKGCKYTNYGCVIENNYDENGYSEVYSANKADKLNTEEEAKDKDYSKDKNYAVTNPGEANPSFITQTDSNEIYYKTLKDAYNTVSAGGTITVLADTEEKLPVTVTKDLRIDLNGKTITYKGSASDFIYIDNEDAKLMIIDKKKGGSITSDRKVSVQHTIYIKEGCLELYTGTICGADATKDNADGGAVYIDKGTFTMFSGKICGNTVDECGGGVYINKGTFIMYGGEISGNSAEYGGGVCLYGDEGKLYLYGGTISGNKGLYGREIAIIDGKYMISKGVVSSEEDAVWKASGK